MILEIAILVTVFLIGVAGLLFLTPRDRIREAHVVFMFEQLMTWMFGLVVVEMHWIEYPVRIFSHATKSSFMFEYFLFPAVNVIFILRFPEHKSLVWKGLWYLLFPTCLTIVEVWLERYTSLIHFIHWSWIWTWLSLLGTFFLSRIYYKWFFKHKRLRQASPS